MKTKAIIVFVIGVVLFAGLSILMKPENELSENNEPIVNVDSKPREKIWEIVVEGRKIVSGSETLTVSEGDRVTMKITVDEKEEVHLHGYDKSVDLAKNVQGVLSFTANLTGRFPFELEHSRTDLGVLEVMPK